MDIENAHAWNEDWEWIEEIEEDDDWDEDDLFWSQYMEEHFERQCWDAICSQNHDPGCCDATFCPRPLLETALNPALEVADALKSTLTQEPTKGGLLLLGFATLVVPLEGIKCLAARRGDQRLQDAVMLFSRCLSNVEMPLFEVTTNVKGLCINAQVIRNAIAHAELDIRDDRVVLTNSDVRKRVLLEFSCGVLEFQAYLVGAHRATFEFLHGGHE